MEFYLPLKNPVITQKFGDNENSYYKNNGLLGHPGVDMATHWNDLEYPICKGKIYKIFNSNNPDLLKYRSVNYLAQIDGEWIEITYGHCNSVLCKAGDEIDFSTPLATEGNVGEVYEGGRLITLQEKLNGSQAGFHLHVQTRKLKRVPTLQPENNPAYPNQYLMDERGGIYEDEGGFYYFVPEFYNGYNGCFDWMPFCNQIFALDAPKFEAIKEESLAMTETANEISFDSTVSPQVRLSLLEMIRNLLRKVGIMK